MLVQCFLMNRFSFLKCEHMDVMHLAIINIIIRVVNDMHDCTCIYMAWLSQYVTLMWLVATIVRGND